MTLNLIGLGMNENSITVEALKAIKSSKKVYLEKYTVDFPYPIKNLEKSLKKKIILLERERVENESILEEAKKQNISLLVYGDSLSATTHIQLITSCKTKKIKFQIFHNSSILTAVAETGLQLYKFGKTASLPRWIPDKFEPTSFVEIIKENQKAKAHTLLLADIGLEIRDAKSQIKKATMSQNLDLPNKIIVMSSAGTKKQKIFYENLDELPNTINKPYCFIIPSTMHFAEQEAIEALSQ